MAETIYVLNDDPEYCMIEYFDHGDPARRAALQAGWQSFSRSDPLRRQTYKMLLRQSNTLAEVAVDHRMPPAAAGRYRVETFIPGKHATTHRAIFSIGCTLYPTETSSWRLSESLALVDMHDVYDVWFSLGEFYLDPARHPEIGRVRQIDLSREEPAQEISFGPVRWVPLVALARQEMGFDSPVGAPEERQGPFPSGQFIFGRYPLWAGDWFDANPFLSWYMYGYHTGADLNLPGASSADKGKPIYAIGDGLVIYAGRAGSWGNIIVIEHPQAWVAHPDGQLERQVVYSRYGHVDPEILARAGETVSRGQNIGFIGLAAGATSGWHLHFDISHTDILKKRPSYWPDLGALRAAGGRNSHAYQSAQDAIMRQVVSNFVDPLKFIRDNHTAVIP